MEVIELSSLGGVLRDLGAVAVVLLVTLYILAKSPFVFSVTGTYRIQVGKNGHWEPDAGQHTEE